MPNSACTVLKKHQNKKNRLLNIYQYIFSCEDIWTSKRNCNVKCLHKDTWTHLSSNQLYLTTILVGQQLLNYSMYKKKSVCKKEKVLFFFFLTRQVFCYLSCWPCAIQHQKEVLASITQLQSVQRNLRSLAMGAFEWVVIIKYK